MAVCIKCNDSWRHTQNLYSWNNATQCKWIESEILISITHSCVGEPVTLCYKNLTFAIKNTASWLANVMSGSDFMILRTLANGNCSPPLRPRTKIMWFVISKVNWCKHTICSRMLLVFFSYLLCFIHLRRVLSLRNWSWVTWVSILRLLGLHGQVYHVCVELEGVDVGVEWGHVVTCQDQHGGSVTRWGALSP